MECGTVEMVSMRKDESKGQMRSESEDDKGGGFLGSICKNDWEGGEI